MRLRALLLLGASAAASCSPSQSPAVDSARFKMATGEVASTDRWVVSSTGIGPIRFGMTLSAVGATLRDTVLASSVANQACAYLRPKGMPRGASLMIVKGVVARVDVDSAGVVTEAGLGVGDSEMAVMVIHSGRIRVESHKYNGPVAHDLIVSNPEDPAHLFIFETDGSKVLTYRAGLRSAVELSERCG